MQHKEQEGSSCAKTDIRAQKRGFLYTGPVAWNNIPQSLRDTDLEPFKRGLGLRATFTKDDRYKGILSAMEN